MDRTLISKILSENDFTANEVTFYFALLDLGRANAAEIAKTVQMDKASAYRAAERLELKGLIARDGSSYNQKLFIHSIENLTEHFAHRQKELSAQTAIVEQFISTLPLPDSHLDSGRTNTKVFEGDDAIIKLIEDRLTTRSSFTREIQNSEKTTAARRPELDFWQGYIKQRLKKDIGVRLLLDAHHPADKYNRTDPKTKKQVRRLPGENTFGSGLSIYDNKVSFYNTKSSKPIGVIIEDKSISSLLATMFDFIWEQSKQV